MYKPKSDEIYLQRVPLDRQGYTKRGQYFGVGAPLFSYDGWVDGHPVYGDLRAKDRAAAKAELRARFPRAKIHR